MTELEKVEKNENNDNKELKELAVLPLKNVVALPRSIIPVIVGRDFSIKAVEYALENKKEVLLTAQKSMDVKVPAEDEIFHVGTRGIILQASKLPNGTFKILVEGICRSKIVNIISNQNFMIANCEDIYAAGLSRTNENEALWRTLIGLFKNYIDLNEKVSQDLLSLFKDLDDLDYMADTIAAHLQLRLEERQEILETVDLKTRVNKIIKALKKEIEIIKTEQKIRKRVQSQVEKHQKDYYLHEQLRAIQRELGKDGFQQEIVELRSKAKKLKLPKDVLEKVDAELSRLEQMQATSPEATVSRNFVDWILTLPWNKRSKDTISFAQAEEILNKSHAGMKKAKDRIIEFIATKKFAGDNIKRSPIICLAGPPGVGKTSLAKSIADALGREFVRISLGGMRDEAEIRGHRRTYIGAMPGKIIQAMKKAKTVNPVMLLDEIDKMSMDFRGDPASALLEVLDPELNNAFADYFLEVDYNLSEVMFVTTANVIDNIPYPLLDRMEIISLSGYTHDEKTNIAKVFLLPKILKEHALTSRQFKIDDETLSKVIEEYTKEAGVRQLERVLAKLVRKAIQELLENKAQKSVDVNSSKVEAWLGSPKFKRPQINHEQGVGLATGLAWTEAGGDVLEIEVTILKGKGSLSLTGQLGEVMRESAEAALSYVRSRAKEFGLKENFYSDCDIHIHVPEGAIPKDGPSAGITITSALVSALTKVPIKGEIAMTGEVTLRGRVLAVGGLKEKLLAAVRLGMQKVIVPKDNQSDIKEFEKELNGSLEVVYADNMDTVIKEAFVSSVFKELKTSKPKSESSKKSKKSKK